MPKLNVEFELISSWILWKVYEIEKIVNMSLVCCVELTWSLKQSVKCEPEETSIFFSKFTKETRNFFKKLQK